MRTVSAALSAVTRLCSEARRLAQAASGVIGDGSTAGPSFGLAPCRGSTAAGNANGAGGFDRASLAPDARRDRVREFAGVRTRRAGQSAQAAARQVPAVVGRYPTNHALHVEYAGFGLRRTGAATGLVPLVRQAAWRVLAAERPVVRPGGAPVAATRAARGGRRPRHRLTSPHPVGA